MRIRRVLMVFTIMMFVLALMACSNTPAEVDATAPQGDVAVIDNDVADPDSLAETEEDHIQVKSNGTIYLYGEMHADAKYLDKEFELWYEYYHNHGMRHLFMEKAYFNAEFLNVWMQTDDTELPDTLYNEWAGSPSHDPKVKALYEKIKSECPETVFHGTDVGHYYHTTGERYLKYLSDNNLKGSEKYTTAKENMKQGKLFYTNDSAVFRENAMVENFIREFDKLNGEPIMGIYGAAHTGLDSLDYSNSVSCMATQLKERYGDNIYSVDLRAVISPERVEIIDVAGKDYEASYFGKQDFNGYNDVQHVEFWRLENAYEDFKNSPKNDKVLSHDNYPILVEVGQVFTIDITMTDGSVERRYYRSDGYVQDGRQATEGFTVE